MPPDAATADHALRIGCSDLPSGLGRDRYFGRLDYLEVGATFFDPPRPSALARWRRDAPAAAGFGVVAWQLVTHPAGPRGYPRVKRELSAAQLRDGGGMRATEAVQGALAVTAEVAAAVEAEVVVFRTPAEFAPSSHNREVLRAFFAEVATVERLGGAARVWEPQGLWEPELAAQLCGELDVLYGCDPLSNDPLGVEPEFFAALPSSMAYFRVTGLGRARPRLDEYALEALLALAEPYERAWIVLANPGKYPDAIRLRKLAGGEPGEPDATDPPDAP
jgi:uncharacterized protein YecE (DUF72 family)